MTVMKPCDMPSMSSLMVTADLEGSLMSKRPCLRAFALTDLYCGSAFPPDHHRPQPDSFSFVVGIGLVAVSFNLLFLALLFFIALAMT